MKAGTNLALYTGTTVHDALAAIASLTERGFDVDIDTIAQAAFDQIKDNLLDPEQGVILPEAIEFANEQAALTEGMIRGFYKHVWPSLMQTYKVIAVEKEMEYKLYEDEEVELVFMTKPDLIVQNKESGDLVYLEYKTTSSKKDNWINSWETAVQLHSSIMAAEQTLGERPSFVQIIGLYKGYESYGKQNSPFCYAYLRKGNPPFTEDQTSYAYKAGFKRSPTWQLPGGVKDWVDTMPDAVLADQFPMTPPIFVNEDLVKRFFAQRVERELQLAHTALQEEIDQATLDAVFPQHFDQCVPSFGWSCQYRKLCHGNVTDPEAEGYEARQPHHQRELDTVGG